MMKRNNVVFSSTRIKSEQDFSIRILFELEKSQRIQALLKILGRRSEDRVPQLFRLSCYNFEQAKEHDCKWWFGLYFSFAPLRHSQAPLASLQTSQDVRNLSQLA